MTSGASESAGSAQLDDSGLEILSDDECRRLLPSVAIGRVVFTDQALPAVQPVRFAVDDDAVVIRQAAGARWAARVGDAVIAFQVDDIDPLNGRGWTVTAVGRGEYVTDAAERDRLAGLAPQSWAPAPGDQVVRIQIEMLTGRRLG